MRRALLYVALLQVALSKTFSFTVSDTAGALRVARASNATTGDSPSDLFNVLWEGHVVLGETLIVPGFQTLSIKGATPDAAMDGNGTAIYCYRQ
jgi:hypothetical protein